MDELQGGARAPLPPFLLRSAGRRARYSEVVWCASTCGSDLLANRVARAEGRRGGPQRRPRVHGRLTCSERPRRPGGGLTLELHLHRHIPYSMTIGSPHLVAGVSPTATPQRRAHTRSFASSTGNSNLILHHQHVHVRVDDEACGNSDGWTRRHSGALERISAVY